MRCVSSSSHHWPAFQGGCVFREPETSTTPTAWRPWGSWSSPWPSLPSMSSGPWWVQALSGSSTQHFESLTFLTFSTNRLSIVRNCLWYGHMTVVSWRGTDIMRLRGLASFVTISNRSFHIQGTLTTTTKKVQSSKLLSLGGIASTLKIIKPLFQIRKYIK